VITFLVPRAESRPKTREETVFKSRSLKSKVNKPVPRQSY
jgi:hypothetical protein